MEKKLKSVKNNLIAAIILLIIFNFASIISMLKSGEIINIILAIGVVSIIGLFIYAYSKYKQDIMLASKLELIAVIIYLVIVTINFVISIIGAIALTQIFGGNPIFAALSLPTILGYIIPLILLIDTLSIRKLYNKQSY